MRQFDYIAELVDCLEELGWGPYQCDHEDANGQFEINWEFDEALVTTLLCCVCALVMRDLSLPL